MSPDKAGLAHTRMGAKAFVCEYDNDGWEIFDSPTTEFLYHNRRNGTVTRCQ